MKAITFCAALFASALATSAHAAWNADESAAHVKAHVTFLASDLLEGREAGSRGFDIAANYVASQMAQLGLKPAGDKGTYFQAVPLVAFRPAGEGRFVLHAKGDASVPLVFGEDVLPGRNANAPEIALNAPMVFVGFGVVAPERRRDDYAGLDVKGKIVVVLAGAPNGWQTEERAYYASARTKRVTAAAHGALGLVTVEKPSDERRRPFAAGRRTFQSWAMTWRGPDGSAFDAAGGAPNLATVSVAGAGKLFAGAPTPFDAIAAEAEKPGGQPPRFVLPATLEASLSVETKVLESRNVVGLIEGADPKLKDEVIVLSAHLDHIGITPPLDGDGINNGALDNAAGVATTLEVARAFRESGQPPKRTILFLTVTGEEKGLIGAEYFARNPTVALARLAANVDIDMPVLTYDFTDVVAFGANRSGIGPAVARAAGRMGIALSPDPLPEEGLFTRSDHFRFVEVGVPAVFLMTGFANGGEAKFRGFLANCYHRPCDDLAQPIDWKAGSKFAEINYAITRELAEMAERPRWNRGDFFGLKYASPAQRQP